MKVLLFKYFKIICLSVNHQCSYKARYLAIKSTRLEAALLQFYQSKFIENATMIIILWDNTLNNVTKRVETRSLDLVIRDFAASMTIPVFKSEAFGHRSYNLPIPFGTAASLYSEKTTGC